MQGTLKAAGTIWVPAAYPEAQQRAVSTFFQQNGYISYDILGNLGITGSQQQLAEYLSKVHAALLCRLKRASCCSACLASPWQVC